MDAAEILAALEKAEAPDWFLDGALADLFGLEMPAGTPPFLWPPKFTASLDAAMTLVPNGLMWRVGRYIVPEGEAGCEYSARVGSPRFYDAATPAIALCIAAVKARQS